MIIGIGFLCWSCKDDDQIPEEGITIYSGPSMTAYNVETLYSDSGQVKIRLRAPLQREYNSGDREFPEGIEIVQFNSEGQEISSITSDYAKYVKEHDIYTAIGNVVVEDLEGAKTLKSEELHWERPSRKVYTEKFVTIETEKELLTGTGLVAKDDFSEYQILKPEGIFSVEDGNLP